MEQYLFVIDYQNDFVDGALGFPHAAELDAGIAEKIRAYGRVMSFSPWIPIRKIISRQEKAGLFRSFIVWRVPTAGPFMDRRPRRCCMRRQGNPQDVLRHRLQQPGLSLYFARPCRPD